MGGTSELLNYEIYPAIYAQADRVFPELQFKSRGGNWYSPFKLDGSRPEKQRQDKTFIGMNCPFRIKEQGGESVSYWDYIANRSGGSNRDILEKLADLAGVKLPDLSPETVKKIEQEKRTCDIWEAVSSYCQRALFEPTAEAQGALKYLQGRGYSQEHIKEMGIGFLLNQEDLYNHLKETFTEADARTLTGNLKRSDKNIQIGISHKLIIPFIASGRITGIIARTIGTETPKYLYNTGLDRKKDLYNLSPLKGDNDLIIVEGFLDCLAASVIANTENVIALGGVSFNLDQLEEAIKRGAKKITLCLDNDEAGQKQTKSIIDTISRSAHNIPVYIAQLPEGVKDPDQLIKEQGAEAFKQIIKEAASDWQYMRAEIIQKYTGRELTEKETEDVTEELLIYSSSIKNPINRSRFLEEAAEALQVKEEAFTEAADRIKEKEATEDQGRAFTGLITEAQRLHQEGKTAEALDLLKAKGRDISSKGADYSELLNIKTKEDHINKLKEHKPTLKTGLFINKKELCFPAAQISFIAGSSGHGKTAFLIDMAVHAALNGDKPIHLFSYEVPWELIRNRAISNYLERKGAAVSKNKVGKFLKGEETSALTLKQIDAIDNFYRELIDSGKLHLHYVDYTAPELVSAIEYLTRKEQIGAAFIDYVQLLNLPGRHNSRHEELKVLCIKLKDLAVDTKIPIIAGAQFNREVKSRFELDQSCLGESGDLERIANIVIGIWNTNKDKDPPKDSKGNNKYEKDPADQLYLTILKNRDGITGGSDFFNFDGGADRITNISEGKGF